METSKLTPKHQGTVAAGVRRAPPIDWAWHYAVSRAVESEWLSLEDEEAWRDL